VAPRAGSLVDLRVCRRFSQVSPSLVDSEICPSFYFSCDWDYAPLAQLHGFGFPSPGCRVRARRDGFRSGRRLTGSVSADVVGYAVLFAPWLGTRHESDTLLSHRLFCPSAID